MLRARFKDAALVSGAGAVQRVKTFDLFDKVENKYFERTVYGGFISLIAYIIIGYLVITEVTYYRNSKLVFRFSPDAEIDEKLTIQLDFTVATRCSSMSISMDDLTSNNFFGFNELKEDDTWFELDEYQRLYFDSMKHINSYLREEYHAISGLLWKSGDAAIIGSMPERTKLLNKPHDACRVHGELTVSKVAGEILITAGRSLNLAGSRIFIGIIGDESSLNMSHRIDKFSFGESAPGIVHPLEGYEVVTSEPTQYDYFIEVVPTEIDTLFSKTKTFQYSLREHSKSVKNTRSPSINSGIYFRYDIAALKLKVSQERDNIVQFTVRLFSIIGGVFIIAGMINNIITMQFFKAVGQNPSI